MILREIFHFFIKANGKRTECKFTCINTVLVTFLPNAYYEKCNAFKTYAFKRTQNYQQDLTPS